MIIKSFLNVLGIVKVVNENIVKGKFVTSIKIESGAVGIILRDVVFVCIKVESEREDIVEICSGGYLDFGIFIFELRDKLIDNSFDARVDFVLYGFIFETTNVHDV